jgi:hypothetical protein
MPTITGLDIPPGLEDAFWSIFQFSNTSQNVLNVKSSIPTRHKNAISKMNSLFVKWQSLYNGLSSARHIAWTSYWETLPFGSHGGANGWPGSGYSAFIYVNAPRYANGLSLLLDPPAYPELVPNGGFVGGYSPWTLFENMTWSANQLNFISTTPYAEAMLYYEDYTFKLEYEATFRFQFDYVVSVGQLEVIIYNRESADTLVWETLGVGSGHFSLDFTMNLEDEEYYWTPYFLIETPSTGHFTNVSVKRIS